MKQLALSAARVLAVAVVLYVAMGLLLRYTSVINQFIYFPDSTIYQDPGDFGLEFEDVYLTTSDGVRIHGWFVPGSGGPTLIWFHGNGGNISNRADNIAGLNRRLGVSILIIDYRGYGLSEGSPNEQGTYLDAEAAMAHALSRPDVDPERLVLFGRSLGCAVAAEMAVRHDVYAVVLESPFTSISAMASRAYPFLPGLGLLTGNMYDTLGKTARIDAPVMVLHGDSDEIVPFEMGREVFDAATEPKRFYRIRGAGHNDTYAVGGAPYLDALGSFLAEPGSQP